MYLMSRTDRRGPRCRIFANRKIDLGFVKESAIERTLDIDTMFTRVSINKKNTACVVHTHALHSRTIACEEANTHTRIYMDVIYA